MAKKAPCSWASARRALPATWWRPLSRLATCRCAPSHSPAKAAAAWRRWPISCWPFRRGALPWCNRCISVSTTTSVSKSSGAWWRYEERRQDFTDSSAEPVFFTVLGLAVSKTDSPRWRLEWAGLRRQECRPRRSPQSRQERARRQAVLSRPALSRNSCGNRVHTCRPLHPGTRSHAGACGWQEPRRDSRRTQPERKDHRHLQGPDPQQTGAAFDRRSGPLRHRPSTLLTGCSGSGLGDLAGEAEPETGIGVAAQLGAGGLRLEEPGPEVLGFGAFQIARFKPAAQGQGAQLGFAEGDAEPGARGRATGGGAASHLEFEQGARNEHAVNFANVAFNDQLLGNVLEDEERKGKVER